MSDKKHIDRLFQEKFKDFEVKPKANVWENIQNQLEQPKQKPKQVLPMWVKFASIAAILILFIALGYKFAENTSENGNSSTIVDTESSSNNKNDGSEKETSVVDTDKQNNVVNSDNENDKANTNDKTVDNISPNNKDAVLAENESIIENIAKNNTDEELKSDTNSSATISNTNASNKKYNSKIKSPLREAIVNNTVPSNKKDKKANANFAGHISNTKDNVSTSSVYNNKNVVANNETQKGKNTIGMIGVNSNSVTSQNANDKLQEVINRIKNTDVTTDDVTLVNSLNEKEKENLDIALDFTKSNAIEEAIAKNQNLDEKEKEVDRWSVNANIAPVYYNTLGKGSHIHNQFIDNPKNGEINTSYGIQVGYAFNDRLKIRSGLSKLNLSYDTANVIVYETVANSPGTSPLRNIDFIPNNQGQTLSVLSSNELGIQQISSVANDELNAALSQRINYIEVPLEVEYALVNKRFGLNLVGGVSTFVLSGNEVVTEVDNRKTLIGHANNINNISFSTNLGLGIDYKFNDSFKLNLEPTFKYQINAFNDTSGDFKPYIIGVYTGFSYKF